MDKHNQAASVTPNLTLKEFGITTKLDFVKTLSIFTQALMMQHNLHQLLLRTEFNSKEQMQLLKKTMQETLQCSQVLEHCITLPEQYRKFLTTATELGQLYAEIFIKNPDQGHFSTLIKKRGSKRIYRCSINNL